MQYGGNISLSPSPCTHPLPLRRDEDTDENEASGDSSVEPFYEPHTADFEERLPIGRSRSMERYRCPSGQSSPEVGRSDDSTAASSGEASKSGLWSPGANVLSKSAVSAVVMTGCPKNV